MQQAAHRKGVSYLTVAKAVRSGRLLSQRLGRQVLITPEHLEAWQPMRQLAPRKYRRPDPDPGVLASALTQDALDRATLEAAVPELAYALIRATGSLSLEQLQEACQVLSRIVLSPEAAFTPSEPSQPWHERHRDAINAARRTPERRASHAAWMRMRRASFREQGVCIECGAPRAETGLRCENHRSANAERSRANAARKRAARHHDGDDGG